MHEGLRTGNHGIDTTSTGKAAVNADAGHACHVCASQVLTAASGRHLHSWHLDGFMAAVH
jgi:hypothetical protein